MSPKLFGRDLFGPKRPGLIPSLFQAIVEADADALVMRSGEQPFLVSPKGQVKVAIPELSSDGVDDVVRALPQEVQDALEDLGAVEYEFSRHDRFPDERFTLSATREGDEGWAEIRRRRLADLEDHVPAEFFETAAPVPAREFGTPVEKVLAEQSATPSPLADDALAMPHEAAFWPGGRPPVASEHDDDVSLEPASSRSVFWESQAEAPPISQPPPVSEPAPPTSEIDAGAIAKAARAAVSATVTGAVGAAARLAVNDAVPGAVAEAARNAVADRAPAAVADATPGAVAEAARAAVAEVVNGAVDEAARAAVTEAAPERVAEAARQAVTDRAPTAVDEAARSAVAGLVEGAVGKAVQTAVTGAVPDAVAEASRTAVTRAVTQAVPEAVAEAVRSAVTDAAPAAIAEAARAAIAEAVPKAVDEAARAAVAGAVSGAISDAARAAVAEAAKEAVLEAVTEARTNLADAVPAAVEEAARKAIAAAVPDAVAAAVRASVAEAAPKAVSDAARTAVTEAAQATVTATVPGAVSDAVRKNVAAAVPLAVDAAVRTAIGSALPDAVAAAVRAAVSDIVPKAVRAAVTESVPTVVADAAREAVAKAVATSVTDSARAAVADAVAAIKAEAPAPLQFPRPVDQPPRPVQRNGPPAFDQAQAREGGPYVPPRPYDPVPQTGPPEGGHYVRPYDAVQPTPPPKPAPPLPPIKRSPINAEPPSPPASAVNAPSDVERLLRVAGSRGASTLYITANARPSMRVDGQVRIIDSEPAYTAADVISLLTASMPVGGPDVRRTGAAIEWIADVKDIGRVRCAVFTDHVNPAGVFRIMPVGAVTVDQLGLTREIQSLALAPDGLILVTGPRGSGKRTLMSALVDLINRSIQRHVITIEREINIVHAQRYTVISQREVRGSDEDVTAAARAALREDPDVLVIDEIRTGALMTVALEAAASGRLVIGGFSAHSPAESIDRILDRYLPGYTRREAQLALADSLRAVISQVLMAKAGGGLVPAREILLKTDAVARLIAEGHTSQIPMAIEAGRQQGMRPLTDTLVSYAKNNIVDVREAYRHATDRPAFIALLKRHGIDTSAIEIPA